MKKAQNNTLTVVILFGLFVAVLAGWLLVAVMQENQEPSSQVITVEKEQVYPEESEVSDPAEINEEVSTSVEVSGDEDSTDDDDAEAEEDGEEPTASSSVEASVLVQ